MKARSKVAAVALSMAAVTALAACGGGDDAAEGPTTVEYWLWQDDATDTTWDDLAKDFNATHDDVQVNLTTIPLEQYQDRLLTAASSGTAACAARSKDWWLGQFAPQGILADLTDQVEAWDGKDDVIDSLWDTGRLPGSDAVYMLPHQYVTLWLYYNKDRFAEAGLEPPTTQQEFLDAAAALTDAAAGKYAFDVRGGAGGQDQWMAWMFAGGADVVDSAGDVVLDSPEAVAANERYLSVVTELDAAPPGSVTAAFAPVQTNFAAGTTAMMIHHPGSLNAMREALGDALGVVPIPVGDGAGPSTLTSMSGNVVLQSCKDKDAAFEWISWLATEEPMRTVSTSIQGQLPVLESVAASEPFSTDPDLQLAVEAARTAKSWPALPGVAQLAAKEFQTQVQIALQGQQSSEEMLAKLVTTLEQD
ncbi:MULTISPECIES: ABC transporter substrate-binding protein [Cellulomonas]|uniref:Multiple sugar transport system substrate-binding protein n=1 Tax=Cellulomonas iranensis TaxID=76862 RepID=A0ABU0GKY7_9CELL|nr:MULTISPECIES: sugar ABC transporter substrate-binding protein [Cellulomonas]MDQ0425242.1 multiple sugar transport system substrate-binding protein [Cellulomonas iranensis]TFH71212.1 sugar ABC transporter substrate-binding protein [Cellulomonas sp. HD19AZ1]